MSLEQAIANLTAAVEANTAALTGGTKPAASAGAAKSEKPAAAAKAEPKGYQAKHTKEAMQAALSEVKEKMGTPAAKAVMVDLGHAGKMGEITDPKLIDDCYEAAKAKLAEAEEAM